MIRKCGRWLYWSARERRFPYWVHYLSLAVTTGCAVLHDSHVNIMLLHLWQHVNSYICCIGSPKNSNGDSCSICGLPIGEVCHIPKNHPSISPYQCPICSCISPQIALLISSVASLQCCDARCESISSLIGPCPDECRGGEGTNSALINGCVFIRESAGIMDEGQYFYEPPRVEYSNKDNFKFQKNSHNVE